MKLSVVIPALDAAETLPACLASIEGAGEIVVVDGGSRDATVAIAEAAAARVVYAPKGRGVQLRAGGEAASGDWLLFLHADTRLSPGWREAIAAHVHRHPAKAACFRLRLDDPARQARFLERAVAARVSMLGLPYGDQGMVVPAGLYRKVGGYRPLPLMEDVDLVRRIGRRRLRALPADAMTSAARWQAEGWLRRSARNLACLGLWHLGVPPHRLLRLYEGKARRA